MRPIGEGGDHSSWWIGADHVLRMALTASASAGQQRELRLRGLVRPFAPVAASVADGEWAPGRHYTLDTRLPGVSAELRDISGLGEARLAAMLAGLRGLTGTAFPVVPARDLGAAHRAATRAAARLGLVAPQPMAPASTPMVLLHNDLKGEHLLVDEAGDVTGVLDWADAAIGDPAEDIAGLVIAIGAAAALRVGAHAGYDPVVCARGHFLARCDTVVRLADRLAGADDSPLPLLRAQLDRAWQGVA